MARSKRKSKPTRPKADHREEVHDEPDPNKEDYFYDDVDKFHAEREKILLDSTAYKDDQSSDEKEQDEEVMALNIDESDDGNDDDDEIDDDDDENDDDDNDLGEEEEEEDSDEEEDESEDEKGNEKDIPSQKSWGRKKAAFYNADIVEEYAGSDEEMDKLAEEEEEEAMALQRHMTASLEEQDFFTNRFEFQLPKADHKKGKEDEQNKERIVQDLTKLSKAQKIQLLMEDSPELFQLMEEFKSKLKEVIEKLHPLIKMARNGQIPKEGANYLELKHQLYLNYCINIGFYLLLKAKKLSARDHPVMETLVQYQKLITELKPLDEKLKPEIEELLSQSRVSGQNGLQANVNSDSVQSKITPKKPSKNSAKLSTLLDDDDEDDDECVTRTKEKEPKLIERRKEKKRKRKGEGETEAMDPLEYYEAVKLQKKRKKEKKQAAFGFTEKQVVDEDDIEEGKRGITYEISQNKGLTAKKKKELRNPRVKHRKKFYRAQIKRKSQVLPVVNEQNRYGGEMTGIRSHLTRSVKIK